jgi:hypothetical protein
MKIQKILSSKESSPESPTETLTKNVSQEKAAGGATAGLDTKAGEKSPHQAPGGRNEAPSMGTSKFEANGNGATAIFLGMKTKEEEKEHYNFLNQMRVRLNVDKAKIIDLEARISCKYTQSI